MLVNHTGRRARLEVHALIDGLSDAMAIKPQNITNRSLLDCDFCHSELQPEKYAGVGVSDHAESL